jgi:hypothetical protein
MGMHVGIQGLQGREQALQAGKYACRGVRRLGFHFEFLRKNDE